MSPETSHGPGCRARGSTWRSGGSIPATARQRLNLYKPVVTTFKWGAFALKSRFLFKRIQDQPHWAGLPHRARPPAVVGGTRSTPAHVAAAPSLHSALCVTRPALWLLSLQPLGESIVQIGKLRLAARKQPAQIQIKDRLQTKAIPTPASQVTRKERTSDKIGVAHGGGGCGRGGWAGPRRPVQQFCHVGMHVRPLPGPEQGSGSWGLADVAGPPMAVQGRAPFPPHRSDKTVTATTPNLFRELPVNWDQTCLEFQRGIVSIFHTVLLVYNSLRELTLRLGSCDKPPKMKQQARGQGVGRRALPWATRLL